MSLTCRLSFDLTHNIMREVAFVVCREANVSSVLNLQEKLTIYNGMCILIIILGLKIWNVYHEFIFQYLCER